MDERSSDQLWFITPENAVVFTYHVIDVHVKSLAFIGSVRLDTHARYAMFIAEPLSQCSVNRKTGFSNAVSSRWNGTCSLRRKEGYEEVITEIGCGVISGRRGNGRTANCAARRRTEHIRASRNPAGPLVGVVNAMVTAFNNQDRAYFQKMIAPDAIWFDEDGHHMAAGVWMNRILSATAPRKLTISNLRVANWDTAGWAGFNYVVDETGRQLKGTNTLVFKKNGNDWQIVVIHGAIDTFAGAH